MSVKVAILYGAKPSADVGGIDKSQVREEKSKEAIALALKGRWEEAIQANQDILQFFPTDAEALNRLGKALMETGRYAEAREAFEETLRLSPHNAIAKKNLERLTRFQERAPQQGSPKKVAPRRFVEESGRSGIAMLTRLAPSEVLERVAPGDAIELQTEGHTLTVTTPEGEYLGQVEPRLALRLSRLMRGGNQYEGAVVSVRSEQVAVLLVEVFRHPDQAGVASFLTRGNGDYRAFLQDTTLQYSADEERDTMDMSMGWQEDGDEPLGTISDVRKLDLI